MLQHFKSLKLGDTVILKDGRITTFIKYTTDPNKISCRVIEMEDQYGNIIRRHAYVYLREVAEIIK